MDKKETRKINKWCDGLYQLFREIQDGYTFWGGCKQKEKKTLKLISEVREYLNGKTAPSDYTIDNQEATANKMTDKQLVAEAKQLHETIFYIDCFGVKDLIRYEQILKELDARDYNVSQDLRVEK